MRVEVRLKSATQPTVYDTPGAYTKEGFYCIPVAGQVVKYPIDNIFSIIEDYGYRSPKDDTDAAEGFETKSRLFKGP